MEEALVIQSTVSRLSHHCFKLCNISMKSPDLEDKTKECIKKCVANAFATRNYVRDRWEEELPKVKKYNKSLEFTSISDLT